MQAANSLGRTVAADIPVHEFTLASESWQVEDLVEDDEMGVIAYELA